MLAIKKTRQPISTPPYGNVHPDSRTSRTVFAARKRQMWSADKHWGTASLKCCRIDLTMANYCQICPWPCDFRHHHMGKEKIVFPIDQYIIQKCFIDSPPTVFLRIAQNIPWFICIHVCVYIYNLHPEFQIIILQYTDISNFGSSLIWCHDCEVVPTRFTWVLPPCFSVVSATNGLSSGKIKLKNHACFHGFPPQISGGWSGFSMVFRGFPIQTLTQLTASCGTTGFPYQLGCRINASADPQAAVARFTEFLPVAVGLLDDLVKLDWFKGKFTGNPQASWGNWMKLMVSCKFALKPIQSLIYDNLCIYGVSELIHQNGCVDMCIEYLCTWRYNSVDVVHLLFRSWNGRSLQKNNVTLGKLSETLALSVAKLLAGFSITSL